MFLDDFLNGLICINKHLDAHNVFLK